MSLEEQSKQLKEAEIAMYKAMRHYRPRKDVNPEFPGERDRDVEMKGQAAEAIAEFSHLTRLWELEQSERRARGETETYKEK